MYAQAMKRHEDGRTVQESRSLYGFVSLVYLIALLAVGTALVGHFGFPLDDSWIHQSVARNYATFGSLGYLPHERSSGSTSLLWTLILSCNYTVFPNVSPVIFTFVVNAALLIVSGLLLLRLALRDGLGPVPAMILAAAPAFDGNYVWLAFTGMEHLLFVTLSLGSVLLWLGAPAQERSWGRAVGSGICMGLLTMTRPEAVVLPPILLACSVVFPGMRKFTPAQTAVAAALVLACAAIPIAVNLYTAHSPLPVTFKGRQFLFAGHGDNLTRRALLVAQWLARPFKAVMVFDGLGVGRTQQIAMLLAFLGLSGLALFGLRALIQQRRWLTLIICSWATLHAVLFAIALPASGHGGRYQPLFLALTLALPAFGITALLSGRRLLSAVVPTASLAACGAVSLTLWHAVLAQGVDHISQTHGAVSAWLDTHLPHEHFAAFDIGRIGYDRVTRGEASLIDLGGLTDPAYIDFLTSRQVSRYLAARSIHYLVLPVDPRGESGIGQELGLVDVATVHRRVLFRACSAEGDWQIPWSETRSAFQCQEVDGVEFEPAP